MLWISENFVIDLLETICKKQQRRKKYLVWDSHDILLACIKTEEIFYYNFIKYHCEKQIG